MNSLKNVLDFGFWSVMIRGNGGARDPWGEVRGFSRKMHFSVEYPSSSAFVDCRDTSCCSVLLVAFPSERYRRRWEPSAGGQAESARLRVASRDRAEGGLSRGQARPCGAVAGGKHSVEGGRSANRGLARIVISSGMSRRTVKGIAEDEQASACVGPVPPV